jgi:two-component system, cell cycle response regulator
MQTNKKILTITVIMLLVVTAISIFVFFYNFKSYTYKSAKTQAISIAENVRDGLTAHMVNGTMDQRAFFLANIARHQNIENFHLLRAPSVVKQYGTGFTQEIIPTPMEKAVLNTKNIQTNTIDQDGKSILKISIPYIATVNDVPNCMTCHTTTEGDVLGVISMDIDITATKQEGVMIAIEILAIVFVVLIISIFIMNYFIKPYVKLFDDLEDGITRIYRGDFSYEVDTKLRNDAGKVAKRLNELAEIYKFKKTIELDSDKFEIYDRLIQILKNKFNVTHYRLFEIKNKTKEAFLITETISGDVSHICNNANLCRAFRTSKNVHSSDFENICPYCDHGDNHFICLNYVIDDDYSIVLHIRSNDPSKMENIKKHIPIINNFFEIAKPVIESKILMTILKDSTLKDPMTGLYNRRFLDELLESNVQNRVKDDHCHAIMMLDIDFFKQVNDTYGHDIGDEVIKRLAGTMKDSIRDSDMAVRYGGEEFIIFLLNTNINKTVEIAQRICDNFKEEKFAVGSHTFNKTLSIGISYYPTDSDNLWNTIKHADEALYYAKNNGRNQVIEFERSMVQ